MKRGMEGRTQFDFRKGVKDIVIGPSWLHKYIPAPAVITATQRKGRDMRSWSAFRLGCLCNRFFFFLFFSLHHIRSGGLRQVRKTSRS